MQPYPYPDLAHSRHRDAERRASQHRLLVSLSRRNERPAD